MKRAITGTAVGRVALSVRDTLNLVGAAYARPEIAGTMANDHLASQLLCRLCADDMTFLDVGAHIGSIVAAVLHANPSVKVVAVEAIPEKVAHLRRKFPTVEVLHCAASEKDGETTFFVNTKRSGYSSLGQPSGSALSEVVEIKVPLRKLDDLVPSGGVDVIKIDVEGAELGVLRGSERIVAESQPTIMFESGPQSEDGLGYTKEALWQWFADRDYAVLVPNRVAHEDPGLSLEGFLESHLYPRRTTNYFAVARKRRLELRDRARVALDIEVT
jgi:FkbM family methyltransferase